MARTKAFNQELVLDMALQLFWKKGYFDTSIQDLVDELGINRGSLYDTFGGKKELFYSSFELHLKENIMFLDEFLCSKDNVKDGIHEFFEIVIRTSVKDKKNKGCFIVNTTMELIPSDMKVEEMVTKYRKDLIEIFRKHLEIGKKKGVISKNLDIAIVSSSLYTILTGMRVTAKTTNDSGELQDILNIILAIME